jgi:hypothetical protein
LGEIPGSIPGCGIFCKFFCAFKETNEIINFNQILPHSTNILTTAFNSHCRRRRSVAFSPFYIPPLTRHIVSI